MRRYIPYLVVGLAATLPAWAGIEAPVAQRSPSEILSSARQAEVETIALYQAFSRKASEESYAGIESLFNALAFSERVHTRNHDRSLKRLGVADQTSALGPALIGGTRANLERAAQAETLEWQEHYPELIAEAQDAAVWEPLRSMRQTKIVESKHLSLIKAMLADPSQWTQQHTYAVCSRCGYVAEALPRGSCPVCQAESDRFAFVG